MKIRLKHRKLLKYLSLGIVSLILLVFILDRVSPFKPHIEFSQIIEADDGSILHAYLTSDDKWRMKTELEEITPELKKTIIYKEDKFFKYHFGINPVSVCRAMLKNIFKGEIQSGASTITMQVARMLEPKERTYKNKSLEMFRAVQLEIHYSKNEILQMYLNLVPYGGNIEGIKAASLLYFEQKPQQLSLAQIVTLSIIPNDPNNLRLGQDDTYILNQRNKWLSYFDRKQYFNHENIEDAKNESVTGWRHEAPKMAPHFSYFLKNKYDQDIDIKTHLNVDYQSKIEKLAFNYIQRLQQMNITNASVLVVDNESRKVIAYLGSADFYNSENQGQVDGVRAVRSPGSTLKPFLYGLAFDEGFITPKKIISDVPINYNGYIPENYDGKYLGQISVEDALALSLNIPAVKILDEMDEAYFINKLGSAGFNQIQKDQEKLGLSTILGGCGVTLAELTNLFATIASEGIYKPLAFTESSVNPIPDTLLTKESCYMVTQTLTKLKRPDLPYKFENSTNLPKIAWKTGTSYGRRDAWAIGYSKTYTVGVWVGNFPGIGVPELNGAEYAVPLLFQIFNIIEYQSNKLWFYQPENLYTRTVCSESGMVPNDFCEHSIEDYYIPGISHHQKCQHLKYVFIDKDEKFSYCRSCLPKLGYKKKLYPNLNPEIITFYNDNQIPYVKIPPHNPRCERVQYENSPKIISLLDNMEYLLFKGESNKLALRAEVESSVQKIYWYIDDKLIQSCDPNEKIFFEPKQGEVKISCVDDKGRNSEIYINVKYI